MGALRQWLPRHSGGLGLLGAGGSILAVPALAYGVGQPLQDALFGSLLPDQWLLVAFAGLMAVVAVRMLRGDPGSGGACRTSGGGINWQSCLPKAVAAGAGVGVLTGLFAGAALLASLAAGRAANRLPAAALRRGFAYLILAVAAGAAAAALATG